MTSRAEIRRSFLAERPNRTEQRLLETLAAHPGYRTRALAHLAGYRDYGGWNLQFGLMCARRFPRRPSFQSGALATYDGATDTWTLRVEALEALVKLGILRRETEAATPGAPATGTRRRSGGGA
jgi:hypothetical protein